MSDSARTALVVGFAPGLQSGISDLLARHHFMVSCTPRPEDAAVQVAAHLPNLIVVTGRCGVEAILSLIAALPVPRTTRVVVLLPGADPAAERQYRAAGVRVVLRMPVRAEDLVRAGVTPASESAS